MRVSNRVAVFSFVGLVGILPATAPAQVLLYRVAPDPQSEGFGESVVPVGDVDHDGLPDFLVGESLSFNPRYLGRAAVHSGVDGHLLWDWWGAKGDRAGMGIAGAGDLDGDGAPDLLVGAPYSDNAGPDAGAVWLYSGATGALLRAFNGSTGGQQFGVTIATVGDLDGDGIEDLGIGAPLASNFKTYAGAVYLYSSASGASLGQFDGFGANNKFGAKIVNLGDVDHDSRPDFAVGAPERNPNGVVDAGSIYVYSGASLALLYEIQGDQRDLGLGLAMAGGVDLDADGVGDLVVGLPNYPTHVWNPKGAVVAYSGSSGALDWIVTGSDDHDSLGWRVAVGDADSDGRAEVLTTIPSNSSRNYSVDLLSGDDGRRLYKFDGKADYDGLGSGLCSLGDVSGDGIADYVLGRPGEFNGGAVYVYSGSDLWLNVDPRLINVNLPITTTIGQGEPGNPTMRFVVDVNGTPTFLALPPAVNFDGAGFVEFVERLPAGLAGLTVTLRAYAVPASGPLLDSNDETVVIQ